MNIAKFLRISILQNIYERLRVPRKLEIAGTLSATLFIIVNRFKLEVPNKEKVES